jgi:hypothetical protein
MAPPFEPLGVVVGTDPNKLIVKNPFDFEACHLPQILSTPQEQDEDLEMELDQEVPLERRRREALLTRRK